MIHLELDLKALIEGAKGLGLSGAVAVLVKYLHRRLSVEGRQARLNERLAALASPNVAAVVSRDPLLESILNEERSATLFESLTGLRARGPFRDLLIRFVEAERGKYTFPGLQALDSLGRWDGQTFVPYAGIVDRGFNWLYRIASLGLAVLGAVLAVAAGVQQMAPRYLLSALAIVAVSVMSLAYFVNEHRKLDLAEDLARFSRDSHDERMASTTRSLPSNHGVHTPDGTRVTTPRTDA